MTNHPTNRLERRKAKARKPRIETQTSSHKVRSRLKEALTERELDNELRRQAAESNRKNLDS